MTLTRREKNAFPAITDAMEGKIFSLFPSYQENDFLKYFYSRHDCQDGSDENDCDFSNIKVNKKFMWEAIESTLMLQFISYLGVMME